MVLTRGTETISECDCVWAVWMMEGVGAVECVTSEGAAASANVVTGALSFGVEIEVKATTG